MHSRSHYTNSHAEAHSLEGQDTFVSIHPLCPLEFGSKENGTHARCDKERLANQILWAQSLWLRKFHVQKSKLYMFKSLFG